MNRIGLCGNCNGRKGRKAWGQFLDEERAKLPSDRAYRARTCRPHQCSITPFVNSSIPCSRKGTSMQITLTIPKYDEPDGSFTIINGQCLFVVGRNGSGKSSLIHYLYRTNPSSSRWVPAHRQNALSSGMSSMTAASRAQYDQNDTSWSRRAEARWYLRTAPERPNAAMFDLLDRQNQRNNRIAHAVDSGDTASAEAYSKENRDPLDVMSDLLSRARLAFHLEPERGGFVAVRASGERYTVDRLSDGERNVFLLCCDVLTAPAGTMILVDEPERHLHPAISAPLLADLMRNRPDCAFVVATNDLSLTASFATSSVIVVRECRYQGDDLADRWDFDILESPGGIDEQTRIDILGARRNVVFIEGTHSSLDYALYRELFPETSIIPKGARRVVEASVRSIRTADQLHRIRCFGIIDSDGDSPSTAQADEGIIVLDAHSVESIYLDWEVVRRVAVRQAAVIDEDVDEMLQQARQAALSEAASKRDSLAQRVALRELEAEWKKVGPDRRQVDWTQPWTGSVSPQAALAKVQEPLDQALKDGELENIIRHYPIKYTAIPARIAEHLGFADTNRYFAAVLKLIREEDDARSNVMSILGSVPEELKP